MEYLKNKWEFYKKIDLKDLWKLELIKLIKEAIEYEPERVTTIIERNQPYYINRYPTRQQWLTLCDSNLNSMDTWDLRSLCCDAI
jgi:hypothetical protein